MKTRTFRKCIVLSLFIVFASGAFHVRSDTIVVPNIYTDTPAIGPGLSAVFNRTNNRWQQIYSSSEFAVANGDVLRIEELRFRVDEDYSVGTPFSTVARGLSIFMSVSDRTFDASSTAFVETDLFESLPRADLSLSGSRSSVSSFDVVIPLPRPYIYDRRSGNLVVDIQIVGGANLPFLDQQIGVQEAAFSIGGDIGSLSGMKTRQGVVTQFGHTVIPEPHTIAFVLFGLFILLSKTHKK